MRWRLDTMMLLLAVTTLPSSAYAQLQKNRGAFTLSQSLQARVAAVADWNADKFADLFTLSQDATVLSLYLWDNASKSFASNAITVYDAASADASVLHKRPIANVMVADIDYDGHLDVLLSAQEDKPASGSKQPVFVHALIRGNPDSSFAAPTPLFSTVGPQPLLLDYQGRMSLDLLGYQLSDTSLATLSLWQNAAGDASSQAAFLPPTSVNTSGADTLCTLDHPHSSAFVDLNGDCQPDIFLTCRDPKDASARSYQIWARSATTGQFGLSRHGSLPSGSGAISFADMNADGTLDAVFPVCDTKSCAIHVVHNFQIPLCARHSAFSQISQQQSALDASACRELENLCLPDNNFTLNFDVGQPGHLAFPLKDLSPNNPFFVLSRSADTAFHTDHPVPLRIGDYNLDGFPDVMAIVSPSSDNAAASSPASVLLLQSVLCTLSDCTPGLNMRSFAVAAQSVSQLTSLSSVLDAAWIDVGDDGTLDVLAIVQDPKTQAVTTQVVLNQLVNDAFFMKTLTLNGAKTSPPSLAYGAASVGATFKYTVIDTSGRKKAVQVTQLSQTSYASLQTPYALVGLGRTNNYIEEMFVGVSANRTNYFYAFNGVVPNSQLVAIPDVDATGAISGWKLELYINPGSYALLVLATLLVTMFLLSLVVGVLHVVERREDERERRKALHVINYDAL
ncbi:hypothetical protein RI367_002135 [Sorochytrium milnesiophthora]